MQGIKSLVAKQSEGDVEEGSLLQYAASKTAREVSPLRLLCTVDGQATDCIEADKGLQWFPLEMFDKGGALHDKIAHVEDFVQWYFSKEGPTVMAATYGWPFEVYVLPTLICGVCLPSLHLVLLRCFVASTPQRWQCALSTGSCCLVHQSTQHCVRKRHVVVHQRGRSSS